MSDTSQSGRALLGGLTANEFLNQHWQRQPLLVRGAFAGFTDNQQRLVTGDELAGLALDPEVEARIVSHQAEQQAWTLRHGPFSEADFAQLPDQGWTLLVQALELWQPTLAPLLDVFDFIPRWRIDDVMASYAAPGGSVGPHFDAYDVFLIQLEGQRDWHLGERCNADTPLQPNSDLAILADFAPIDTWRLEPGDMLYLPPQFAHWGVASSACITLSVGFRSPTLTDMLADLAIELGVQGNQAHYQDPRLDDSMASGDIHVAFVQHAQQQLVDLLNDEALLGDWFARYMTQPKYPEILSTTGERRTAQWQGATYQNGEQVSRTKD